MYDQYAYYHYETVEEKPVPKPPVLVSFSEERAAKERRAEKGLARSFQFALYLTIKSFSGLLAILPPSIY